MPKYGYARVSTTDQDLTIQEDALKAFGCDVIRGERVTGTSTTKRQELRTILDFIREGDTLVVTRIDRLARSMGDLQDIVRELRGKGASLVMTEQQIDTSTPAGKAFLDMLGVFAEFETNLRAERQREGIAAAREAGVYKNRKPPTRKPAVAFETIAAKAAHIGPTKAAEFFGISRAHVYRAISAADTATKLKDGIEAAKTL